MTRKLRAGVVIVNFNCAPFAIDAALSVLGQTECSAQVVIVDNASTDGSPDHFKTLAREASARAPDSPSGSPRVTFCDPASTKVELITKPREWSPKPLSILLSPVNGGFAAGANLGFRTLLQAKFDLLVLLNPDALAAEGSIAAFAERLEDPTVGLCGASVLSYDRPGTAQAFGGATLDPLTLVGRNIGEGCEFADAPGRNLVESRLDYPLGAVIALRPDYVSRAGFLDERYFLYFEEADWAFAGRKIGRVGWARDAVVYHRYGGSTRSRRAAFGAPSERSALSDYHMARSRLLFALKWKPHLAPLTLAYGAGQTLSRLARGRTDQARAVALGSLPGARRAFPA